jgi:NAD(P)-dependent dehydrogenase (short-subunit alcohol dehydrogenase family)
MADDSIQSRVELAVELLEMLVNDRGPLAEVDPDLRMRLLMAAGRVSRPDRDARRKLQRAKRRGAKRTERQEERALLDQTGIRQLRENPIFLTPRRKQLHSGAPLPLPIGETRDARTCYVCREKFTAVHFFYDQMCPTCGDLNYAKRHQTADLTGRVAIVTGARVKIGFQAAIMLLRSGASVVCLTRFPQDAARRYAAEEDFADWGERLSIYGIDLRHTPSVEQLCARLLADLPRLDFLINNACQTVRRPPGFYDHLVNGEIEGPTALPGLVRPTAAAADLSPAQLTQVPLLPEDLYQGQDLFPAGLLDADLQQVDLRKVNSWRLKMAEVPTIELIEVHLVNAVAPFLLNARLKPLMTAVPTRDKHIVNVSAMEGQFYRTFKSDRHPHTNMAKAALNMMTRTSAMDYIDDGIHMNAVDTGWVTDEDPVDQAVEKREMHGFHPPLDIVDGAARIIDPILSGLNSGEHVWGQFLKDYRITDW